MKFNQEKKNLLLPFTGIHLCDVYFILCEIGPVHKEEPLK